MKKKRRLLQSDTFWGLAAALVVVLQFWWLPGEDGSASDSYSTTVDGKLGLYRTLSQLYPRVERDALQVVPAERSCLVLIAPDRYPSDAEQSQLCEFVDNGGTLVFAPRWDVPECEMRLLGIHTTERVSTLSNSVTLPRGPTTTPSTTAVPGSEGIPAMAERPDAIPGDASKAVAENSPATKEADDAESELTALNASDESSAKSEKARSTPLTVPDESKGKSTPGLTPAPGLSPFEDELAPVSTPGETVTSSSSLVDSSVDWHSSADLQVPSNLTTESLVTSTDDRVEAAAWNLGQGRVIACSSPDIFSNRSMLFSASRRLAIRLVEHGYLHCRNDMTQDPPIVLSEYFNASDAYQQTGVLFSPSLRIGTLQLILVAVLGIWLAFYRFGPAEDVSTQQRRSLTESAQAVGNLQYRLQDGGAVIRGYLEYIRSQLRRRYGSLVRLDQPEGLASRAGMDVEEVRARLTEAQSLAEAVQLSPEKTASALRWLASLQQRLAGTREKNKS